ncbi:MAG: hypothetical protein ACFB21_11505 [Opitutales bacterium]
MASPAHELSPDAEPEAPAHFSPQDGWIGVDLDGTLARHGAFSTHHRVGKPVKAMLQRVRYWLSLGFEVRIVTARAAEEDDSLLEPIRKWLRKQKLGDLQITARIDAGCLELWDDRAVNVVRNTGRIHRSASFSARPRAPVLEDAFPHENRPSLES